MNLLNRFLTFLLFVLLTVGFFHPITAFSQDLGRHILLGKIITQTGSIPKTNLLAYTYPDFPFINHHWLSEVIFYGVDSLTGTNGLLVLTVAVVLLTFFILVQYSSKHASLPAIACVFLLYHTLLFERTDVRPEIFSFLFLALFLTILYRNKEKVTRLLFFLPLLELLWVNMHVYFIIGIIVIGLFLCDDLLTCHKKIIQFLQRKTSLPFSTKLLLITFCLSLLSTLINPNGLSGAIYPLKVFQNYGYQVQENQSVWFLWENFSYQLAPLFVASIVFLFLSLFFTIKKTRPVDWFLSVFFVVFAAMYIRNFPLLVFGTLIPFSRSLTIDANFIGTRLTSFFKQMAIPFSLLFSLLLLAFTVYFMYQRIITRPIGFGLDHGASYAADFYIKHKIAGPVFNNFDIGSYFEYRLYPVQKAFIDGRPEAFPKEFIQNVYIPKQREQKTFDALDNKYHFNSIFFSHTDQTPWALQFIQMMMQHPKWKLVYLDDVVMIWLKDNSQNARMITQFAMKNDTITASNIDNRDKNSLLRLSLFYKKALLVKQEKETYHKVLELDPKNCFANYNLAAVLAQEQNRAYELYLGTFQQKCQ